MNEASERRVPGLFDVTSTGGHRLLHAGELNEAGTLAKPYELRFVLLVEL